MFTKLRIYFTEMFPITHVFASIFMALSYYMAIYLISQRPIAWDRFEIYTSAISVMLIIFVNKIISIYQNDNSSDSFTQKKISKLELDILMICIFLITIILNITNKLALIGIGICIGYTFLISRNFFIRKILSKNISLKFLLQQPIHYLNYLYLFMSLYAVTKGQSLNSITAAIGIPIAFAMTNLDLSKSIKGPHHQDTTACLSNIWGAKFITIFSIILQALSTTGMIWLFVKTQSTSIIFIAYFAYFFSNLSAYILFISTYEIKKPLVQSAQNLVIANEFTILFLFLVKAYS